MAEGTTARRGLLVDWGGVLTTDVFASFGAFCEREGLARDAVTRRFRDDGSSRALLVGLETGALPAEEFERRFAAALGVAPEHLIERMFAGGEPDTAMLAAVAAARAAGVRTGLISNSWGTGRYDRSLLAELFDGVVISGEVGIRKPQPRIYELGAEAVGLTAHECVFVDDLPFNLQPARELGMETIHHVDTRETLASLELILGVTLA